MAERISKRVINSILEVQYLQVTAPEEGYLITEKMGKKDKEGGGQREESKKIKGHQESLLLRGEIGNAFKRELLSFHALT